MREDKYIVVEWPESQKLMELDGFRENSYLINDEQGISEYGSSAYFVNAEWLAKATNAPKSKIWVVATLIEYSDDCPTDSHQAYADYFEAVKALKAEVEKGMLNFPDRKGEVINDYQTIYEYREENGRGMTVVIEEYEV